MPDFSATEVIRRVLRGDTEAYREIVREYQQDIWKLAARMLHDRDAAEELVQETFVRAYVHLDRFDRERDFARWLKGIARNLAREKLRALSAARKHLSRYYELVAVRDAGEEGGARYRERLAEALKRCRERLSPRLNALLEMRYVHALSFEHMARKVGKTIEATRQLLWRIKVQLKKCIQKELGGEWNG